MPRSAFTSGTGMDTPLHKEIARGNFTEAFRLVEARAEVNKRNHCGDTPLHLLLRNEAVVSVDDQLKLLRLLLEHGAKVDQQNECGQTALYLAVENSHIAVIERLLQHRATFCEQERYCYTALYLAARCGRVDVIRLLLQHGYAVDEQSEYGNTALYFSAKNGHIAVMELLLKNGAKVDRQNEDAQTALHLVAEKGHAAAIELLLQHGATVDTPGGVGQTALHLAAEKGHAAAIELLLQHGATVDKPGRGGQTALHLAVCNGHIEVMKLLLRHGAKVARQNEFGETALHLAAEQGHIVAIELLLRHGVMVDQRSKFGQTALHLAVNNGCCNTVLCLLKGGADVGAVSGTNGETPLQTAIRQRGNSELGKLLIHEHLSWNPEIQAIKKLITEVRPEDGDGFTQSWCDGVFQEYERSFATIVEFREGTSEGAPVVLRLVVRDLLDRSKPNAFIRHGVRPKVACNTLQEIIASESTKGGCACCLSRLKRLPAEEEERVLETNGALKEFSAYAFRRFNAYASPAKEEPLARIPEEIAEKILSRLPAGKIRLFTQALSPSNVSCVYDSTEPCHPDMSVPSLKP